MKHLMVMLIMACLISLPLAQRASSQDGQPVNEQELLARPEKAVKSKFLFFQLLPPVSAGETLSVEFHIRVDKIPYLVERFTLSQDEARLSPAIEILAAEPAHLKNLYRLAKKEKRKVTVTVMANDQALRHFSFGELRKYNRELKSHVSFRPTVFQSKLFVLRQFRDEGRDPLSLASSSCEQECGDAYSICAQMECGDPLSICGPCLDALNQCYAACPPPPPPNSCPTTTCSSSDQLIGSTWFGFQCLNSFGVNRVYSNYLFHYKRTTTCVTQDPCRGTQSTFSTYSYFDRSCDVPTTTFCNFSSGSPFTCF